MTWASVPRSATACRPLRWNRPSFTLTRDSTVLAGGSSSQFRYIRWLTGRILYGSFTIHAHDAWSFLVFRSFDPLCECESPVLHTNKSFNGRSQRTKATSRYFDYDNTYISAINLIDNEEIVTWTKYTHYYFVEAATLFGGICCCIRSKMAS